MPDHVTADFDIDEDFDDQEWANMVVSVQDRPKDPTTYQEAMQGKHSKKWNTTMTKELSALELENTYKLVSRQQGTKAIGSKWVYTVKTKADGSIERFKARLMAKGFNQKHGINDNETFAPVLMHKSLRVLAALIAQYNLHAVLQWEQ